NGEVANRGARAVPGGVLRAILDETKDPAGRLEAMFAAAYARAPTDAERAALLPRLGRAQSSEDSYFALLTSSDFICAHCPDDRSPSSASARWCGWRSRGAPAPAPPSRPGAPGPASSFTWKAGRARSTPGIPSRAGPPAAS